ncbi:hypothetical protein [Mucilaginibacter sp. L196]|uniref:hypothetical protein n=1 Tax=Mucilaginibacter sp. L196 TaxID=1641870 RepID=UPI00131D36FF|nr:hypothetical protein [Mucilaginibacter sp. L196]
MEKKRINFNDIKGMLSNDQMKKIKGGSTPYPQSCGYCYDDGFIGMACTGFNNNTVCECPVGAPFICVVPA